MCTPADILIPTKLLDLFIHLVGNIILISKIHTSKQWH